MSTDEPASLPETPDRDGAFPRLSEEQIAALEPKGERRKVEAGDILFQEGDRSYDFNVILEGKVAIYDAYRTARERLLMVHGPGRFLGELNLLMGQAVFLTAVVVESGEVLVVPVDKLRQIVTHNQSLGDLILRAFLIRRAVLIGMGTGLKLIGSRFSPDARRLREFCARNRLPHAWIDVEEDEGAEALLRELGVSPEETPVVIWGSGDVLRNPSNVELAKVVGLTPKPSHGGCDLIVVGAGPAGLAAAVYGASEGLDTLAVDEIATGGQAATSSRIENYLGFPSGISGPELAERATLQAEKFGAALAIPIEALSLKQEGDRYIVGCPNGKEVSGRTVVIATGAQYRKLDVPRLEEFESTSVYYAATFIEAQECAGDPVAVVGGGNSAGQAAVFLSQHSPQVRLIIRCDDINQDMSRYLSDEIERIPNIDVWLHHDVRELIGENGTLEQLVVEDNHTGERETIDARALFVFIGASPHTAWLGDEVALDENGFVLTGLDAGRANGKAFMDEQDRQPFVLETTRPGIFAAGDVRRGSIKRVASAVGEGAMAVRLVHEFFAHAPAP